MKADVIVIGGGAAGSVVAGLLSEDPARHVVLLEAGANDLNPLLRVPLATGFLAMSSMAAWRDELEPDPGLGGRRIVWAHGRVLGGSTAINGMVWMRGRPSDYQRWTDQGLSGWDWPDALGAFERIERRPDDDGPKSHGPQPIAMNDRANPLETAFLAAVGQSGRPVTGNLNQAPFEGGGRFQNTVFKGERWSAARSYLPRRRTNLTIVTDAEVARLNIVKGRAESVSYRRQGRMHTLHGAEVVLAAGAINSAKVLMHSGVGPAAHLRARDVAPIVDLPGVGRNLQDHAVVSVSHEALLPASLHRLTRIDNAAAAVARAWLLRQGPATASPFATGFALRSEPDLSEPDLQGLFVPVLNTAIRRPSLRPDGLAGHGYRCAVFAMRPHSRGCVELRSNDPFDAPVIHAGYFWDRRDLERTRKGIGLVREILAQPALEAYRGREVAPGAETVGEAAVDTWIAATAQTASHAVGTCRMGVDNDPLAVVDDRLRVRGVDGLRIADASVMPTITSSNTMAPTMMIGQRCVDFMRANGSVGD
jgi:choline dehydrogenase